MEAAAAKHFPGFVLPPMGATAQRKLSLVLVASSLSFCRLPERQNVLSRMVSGRSKPHEYNDAF